MITRNDLENRLKDTRQQRYVGYIRPLLKESNLFSGVINDDDLIPLAGNEENTPQMVRLFRDTSGSSTETRDTIHSDITSSIGSADTSFMQNMECFMLSPREVDLMSVIMDYHDANLLQLHCAETERRKKLSDEKEQPRSLVEALLYDIGVTLVSLYGLYEGLFFVFGYQETKPILDDILSGLFRLLNFAGFVAGVEVLSQALAIILNAAVSGTDIIAVFGVKSYQSISRAIRNIGSLYKKGQYKELAVFLGALIPFTQSNFTLATAQWSLLNVKLGGLNASKDRSTLAWVLGVNGTMFYTLWQIEDYHKSINGILSTDFGEIYSDPLAYLLAVNDVNSVLVNALMRAFAAIQISLQQIPIAWSDQVATINAMPAGPNTAGVSVMTRMRLAYEFAYPGYGISRVFFQNLAGKKFIDADNTYSFINFMCDMATFFFCSGFSVEKKLDLYQRFVFQCIPKGLLLFFAGAYVNDHVLAEPGSAFSWSMSLFAAGVTLFLMLHTAKLFQVKDELDMVKNAIRDLDFNSTEYAVELEILPRLSDSASCMISPNTLAYLRIMQRLIMFTSLLLKLFTPYVENAHVALLLTLLIVLEDLREEQPYIKKSVERRLLGLSMKSEDSLYGNGVKRLYSSCKEVFCCPGKKDPSTTPLLSHHEEKISDSDNAHGGGSFQFCTIL